MSTSYSFTVTSPKPADEVFDYIADLRNLPEWDPETEATEQVSEGDAVRVGATFRVDVRRFGLTASLNYALVELEHPRRIVARGTSNAVDGVDTFTISPTADGGSEVAYATEIELKGVSKIAKPIAAAITNRSGEKTRAGLEQTLNRA
ncbi:MAG: SRPBCC family protein [Solirubrobacteraceae bacterium]|nr:SRPBCC family protein [Solirubrobacteraceae bacterium]